MPRSRELAELATSYDSGGSLGFRNRIINGAMVIDQRNAGASVDTSNTTGTTYTIDRWAYRVLAASKFTIQQNAGSLSAANRPAGFTNYLGCTSSSAYSVGSGDVFSVWQSIEGFNTADLAFGTASAQAITLSFWVRSSLTGTFSGAFRNNDGSRSYVFTYTISAANTWEYKTITIAGDQSGTWVTGNTIGLHVQFSLGVGSTFSTTAGSWQTGNFFGLSTATNVVGTNGATFYITGVQLEAGSVATPFERRDYGRELMMAQRYYYRIAPNASNVNLMLSHVATTTVPVGVFAFPTDMRTAPTALEQSGTASHYEVYAGSSTIACSAVPTFQNASVRSSSITFTVASGLTVGQAAQLRTANTAAYLGWSAEL